MNEDRQKKSRTPPAIQSRDPESEIEERLKDNPDNCDAKVDLGSDESMDASDPPSVVQPEHNEPVPSSSFEDDDGESRP
ncbi:MAG TPA: hypothetical protein VHN55_00090 [Sphingomicrobium sp.]|nr:hypothetical protein [Sphingomicrobium sp.]